MRYYEDMGKIGKILRLGLPVEIALTVYFFISIMGYTAVSSQQQTPVSTPPSVLGRSYPPEAPDVHKNEGATLALEGMSMIVAPNTFGEDVYVRVERIPRGAPVHVQGMWQVGDMFDVRVRLHRNDNEVRAGETGRDIIFAFPYSGRLLVTDQGLIFNETQLKVAYADSVAGPWSIIAHSVVDPSTDMVSFLGRGSGVYVVVGGWYQSPTPTVVSTTEVDVVEERESLDEQIQDDTIAPITDSQESTDTDQDGEFAAVSQKMSPTVSEATGHLFEALATWLSTLLRAVLP